MKFSHETMTILTKFPDKHFRTPKLKSEILCADCNFSMQLTISHGRNQLLPFLELPMIALTSQVNWWHHQLDYVTLSYERLLDHKLLMWPKWWHHLLSAFVNGCHRSKSQLHSMSPYKRFSIRVWSVQGDSWRILTGNFPN